MGHYILLTNDDGVDAPGLLALKRAVEHVAPVRILAPDHNWSAAGHTKTMHKPLRVKPVTLADGTEAHASDGAPSDCVALAILGVWGEKPVLVVSGINPNANLGHDVLYSGTVAAAMEAALSDVPALAVSLDASTDARDYTFAAEVAARLAARVLQNGLPPSTCLNVNVPARPASEIRGVRVTRLGYRIYRDELIERSDPRGRAYYWIGGEPPTGRVEVEDTDIWAVAHNFVSITPLQFDLTAHAHLKDIEAWARAL